MSRGLVGRLGIAGLVLFIAVDLALVAVAFRHVASPPAGDRTPSRAVATPTSSAATGAPTTSSTPSSPPSSPSPSSAPSPASSGRAAPTSTTTAADRGPQPVAFVALAPDGTVLRASRGDCRQADRPTVTVARGVDDRPATSRLSRLREVVGIDAVSGRDLVVVGLNKQCRPVVYTTADRGGTWTRRPGESGTWHLAADRTAASVVTPGGDRSTPCVPRSVSGTDPASARVLCDDGQMLGTADGGLTWVFLGRLDGAVGIRYADPARGVALARRGDCAAAVMETADGGLGWSRLACLPGRRPRAIDSRGDVVAAQVGDRLHVSRDGGVTWPTARRR